MDAQIASAQIRKAVEARSLVQYPRSGLANQLSIPRSEAGDYIKMYFERFPGIEDYMDETKAAARAQHLLDLIARAIDGTGCAPERSTLSMSVPIPFL